MRSRNPNPAPQPWPLTDAAALQGSGIVNQIMFPAPQPPGYQADSFPADLAWIPRFAPYGNDTGTVPALILPCSRGARDAPAGCIILYLHGNGTDLGMPAESGPEISDDVGFMHELGNRCSAHVVAMGNPNHKNPENLAGQARR